MPIRATDHCRGEHQNRWQLESCADRPFRFERRRYEPARLSGATLGWPNGVPRIANLDEEPRNAKSAKSRPSPPKPLAMPRLIGLTAAGRIALR